MESNGMVAPASTKEVNFKFRLKLTKFATVACGRHQAKDSPLSHRTDTRLPCFPAQYITYPKELHLNFPTTLFSAAHFAG